MKRGGELKRYARLVSRSVLKRSPFKAKPRKPAAPKDVRALLIARSNGWCEIWWDACHGRGTDPSHRKGSKMGGRRGAARDAHDVASNYLWACRQCHEDITSATDERLALAHDTGLLVAEHLDPYTVPVNTRRFAHTHGGPVLLADCGGVWPADLEPIDTHPDDWWPEDEGESK